MTVSKAEKFSAFGFKFWFLPEPSTHAGTWQSVVSLRSSTPPPPLTSHHRHQRGREMPLLGVAGIQALEPAAVQVEVAGKQCVPLKCI